MSEASLSALRIAVLVTVIGLSSVASVYAQTARGPFEIGLEAGPFLFISSSGGETVGGLGLSFEPHIDYFITDQLDVGATGFLYHTFDSGSSSPSIAFGGAYGHVNYHFNPGSTLSSYIGGRIGMVKPNNVETEFAGGIQAGLQYFAAPTFSINTQLDIITSAGFGILSCLVFGVSYYIG